MASPPNGGFLILLAPLRSKISTQQLYSTLSKPTNVLFSKDVIGFKSFKVVKFGSGAQRGDQSLTAELALSSFISFVAPVLGL